jgi:hypothetical protein
MNYDLDFLYDTLKNIDILEDSFDLGDADGSEASNKDRSSGETPQFHPSAQ